MERFNGLQMRSGYDQSLSDTYNIEDFTPNIGIPLTAHISRAGDVYIWVDGDPSYSRGELRLDAGNGASYGGYPQVRYVTPEMHIDALAWLEDTYEGQVTARLRTNKTTYATYNCQLRFETRSASRKNWREVTWVFTLIEAI